MFRSRPALSVLPAAVPWREQLHQRVTHPEELPAGLELTPEERAFFDQPGGWAPPFAVTRHLLSLIDPTDPRDPIRRQFFPTAEELRCAPEELTDPLGEEAVQPVPGLLHRYRDRVLLLTTGRCAAYCRHCFRRRLSGRAGQAAFSAAVEYVRAHIEVRELIFSGGEPLLLSDSRLEGLLADFRRARPDLAFRIHTRMPVALPARITPGLAGRLGRFLPLRVAVQVNHPRELAPAAREAVRRLQEEGIPVLSQSVLLRGVNDRPDVLAGLFRALAAAGIRPYYLFQPDLARGTAHFRTPLPRGLELVAEAKALCGGGPAPRYVQDLPGEGGKVPLEPEGVGQELRLSPAPGGTAEAGSCPGC